MDNNKLGEDPEFMNYIGKSLELLKHSKIKFLTL